MTYDPKKLIGAKLVVVDVALRPLKRTEYQVLSARPYRSMVVSDSSGNKQEIYLADPIEGWEDLYRGYPTWIHIKEVMCYLDPSV